MSNENSQKPDERSAIIEALNHHGAFFHRLITSLLLHYRNTYSGGPIDVTEVVSEHPTFFSNPTVADLVVRSTVSFTEGTPLEPFNLTFVIECKKAFDQNTRIVLIQPVEEPESVRLMRRSVTSPEKGTVKYKGPSHYISPLPMRKGSDFPVCDDGFFLINKRIGRVSGDKEILQWTAEKEPLYKAANQVSSCLMGIMLSDKEISMRSLRDDGDAINHQYLPVIITNVPIFIADSDAEKTDVISGESRNVSLTEVNAAFFIHPFARNSGNSSDIRNDGHYFEGVDPHRDKETILIMNPSALPRLFELSSDSDLAREIHDTFYEFGLGQ